MASRHRLQAMISGMRYDFLLGVLFSLSLVTGNFGAPQSINCSIGVLPFLCIDDPIRYWCRVDTHDTSADTLEWRVLNATGDLLGSSMYGPGASVGTTRSIGTQFTTNLTSTGGPIVSDIAFTTTADINNCTVECRALDTSSNILGTDTCSILIRDVSLPSTVPRISAINPVNYTISLPLLNCYDYKINIINSATNERVVDQKIHYLHLITYNIFWLLNDDIYIIRVSIVDYTGKIFSSGEIRYIFDVPESVNNLTVIQTGLSLDVSWNGPPDSFRPNISNYIMYYYIPRINITATHITIPAPTTTYNIPDVRARSFYFFGVRASNALGPGNSKTTSILIQSTSVPSTTSSVATSLTSSTANVGTITSFSTAIVSTDTSSSQPLLVTSSSATAIVNTVTSSSTGIVSTVTRNSSPVIISSVICITTIIPITCASDTTNLISTGDVSSSRITVSTPMCTLTATPCTKQSELSTGVAIGIGIGIGVLFTLFILLVIVICKRNIIKDNTTINTTNITATTSNPVIYDIPTDTLQFPNVSVSMEENAAYGSASARVSVSMEENAAYGSASARGVVYT